MRSRYSAYQMGNVAYIIETTHPNNSLFQKKRNEIEDGIRHFSSTTKFEGLQILEFLDGEKKAFVSFYAILQQEGHDASFKEKSCFLKENGRWLYESGTFI